MEGGLEERFLKDSWVLDGNIEEWKMLRCGFVIRCLGICELLEVSLDGVFFGSWEELVLLVWDGGFIYGLDWGDVGERWCLEDIFVLGLVDL